ncbi:transcriptional regulator, RpiR family [Gemmobacter aquatilis]|uniref:Transcriptional regulator, RpiR family n=1 Tax=Gemmobacter aquatilis TaxID=933059 RepID=A0A1H7Y7V2_9RHOB|nr:substrate-binding domain-containing protein [Gemmobacter aquatilis]SEM41269.1 transcriptional regulator, RpiR family [Gemmobacter aquatilis]
MNLHHLNGTTAEEIRGRLTQMQADLGKGGRRLADFLLESPETAALLSSAELANRCNVHASSVVRLAQSLGLSGYRELQAILQAGLTRSLGQPQTADAALHLRLLGESGLSFNQAAQEAAARYCAAHPGVRITAEMAVSHTVDPDLLAAQISAAAQQADGLLLVARDHPAINHAVREAVARGVPVICLTSDLPASGRTAYVGSDQYASGATAGWFCGRFLPQGQEGRVLFVCSVPFRCHQDREQGFRQVMRSQFPWLGIEEKVSSDESIEVIYQATRRHIAHHGAPAAIYNVSGANLGVGRALEDEGLAGKTVFIGHELNANSRSLLEKGVMDLTIGHDFDQEIALSVDCIRMARRGVQPVNRITQSLLFTRYNCAIL